VGGRKQIHDFNPGVNPFPDGLFWTMPIPPGSVRVDLDAKTASLDLSHTKIDDYGDVVSALTTDSEIASASMNCSPDAWAYSAAVSTVPALSLG